MRLNLLISAIEAWVIVCVLFVFGALIEYAGLLLKIKIGTTKGVPRVPKKSPSVNRENSLALNGNVEDRKATLRSLTRKKQRDDMSHARLDILFLLLFPLFFLIFNVIYWVSFMYGGPCLDCEEEWVTWFAFIFYFLGFCIQKVPKWREKSPFFPFISALAAEKTCFLVAQKLGRMQKKFLKKS